MPYIVERIMAARQTCSYGMTNEIKQEVANNKRTGSWDIYSIKSGTVVLIQSVENGNQSKDYGNSVIIQDTDGTYVRYAHLESIDLQEGDWVSEGQIIGKMGDTGNGYPAPNKHLHVSVYPSTVTGGFRSADAKINPEEYIKGGTYPANTKISTPYKYKIYIDGWNFYLHEGTDFSGIDINKIDNWNKGLKGKDVIDE